MALPANFFRGATASPRIPTKNTLPPVTDTPFAAIGDSKGLAPSLWSPQAVQLGFSLGGSVGPQQPSKLNATVGGVKLGYWIIGGVILLILGAFFARRR